MYGGAELTAKCDVTLVYIEQVNAFNLNESNAYED
jgi:hypothetical protein